MSQDAGENRESFTDKASASDCENNEDDFFTFKDLINNVRIFNGLTAVDWTAEKQHSYDPKRQMNTGLLHRVQKSAFLRTRESTTLGRRLDILDQATEERKKLAQSPSPVQKIVQSIIAV